MEFNVAKLAKNCQVLYEIHMHVEKKYSLFINNLSYVLDRKALSDN